MIARKVYLFPHNNFGPSNACTQSWHSCIAEHFVKGTHRG